MGGGFALTEKEKQDLLAYLIRLSLNAENDVQQALYACMDDSSVYISERLVRSCIERRIIDKITHDIYNLLGI